jgi:hypothetical protein
VQVECSLTIAGKRLVSNPCAYKVEIWFQAFAFSNSTCAATTWLLSLATYTVSESANASLYAALVGIISGFIAFIVGLYKLRNAVDPQA